MNAMPSVMYFEEFKGLNLHWLLKLLIIFLLNSGFLSRNTRLDKQVLQA
jgi:hypothetical protein